MPASTQRRSASYSSCSQGCTHLLADVLVAAEHEDGVVAVCRRRAALHDLPADHIVAVLGAHVGEELRLDEWTVGDGEDAHHATGTFSSSRSFRRS